MFKNRINAVRSLIASGALVAAGAANAAVDAAVTTKITEAAADVATIGAAVLVVMVGIKVFKWVRGAL